jgi:hypothetical protein
MLNDKPQTPHGADQKDRADKDKDGTGQGHDSVDVLDQFRYVDAKYQRRQDQLDERYHTDAQNPHSWE